MPDKKNTHPIQTRSASFAPASFDEAARTLAVVFATDTPILTRQWDIGPFYEILDFAPGNVRMDRLRSGAPFLNMHDRWTLGAVLGVVETADLDSNSGRAVIRFSKREDIQPIIDDVKDGILTNISCGYRVYRYEQVPAVEGETIPTYRAVDWEPMEVTLCTIPADFNAGTRDAKEQQSNENPVIFTHTPKTRTQMTPEEIAAAAAETSRIAAAEAAERSIADTAVRTSAITAERTRTAEIIAAVGLAKLPSEVATRLISEGVTIDQARAQVIDEIAKADPHQGSRSTVVVIGGDERLQIRTAIEAAILNRAAPDVHQAKDLTVKAREYQHMSMLDIARSILEFNGESTRGISRNEVITRALSTSDYPILLGNVVNRILMAAYQAPEQTWRPLSRLMNASDFKTMTAVNFGGNIKLEKVKEGGEFKQGKLAEGKENWKVETYGKIIAITRQAIINDDLGGFTRLAQIFGNGAANLESDIMWAIITGNPLMGDGKNLFHSGHKNLAGSGAVIGLDTLNAARVAMRKQTGIDGEAINVAAEYLIVPPELEMIAQQFTAQIYSPTSAAGTNVFQGTLKVIAEPRLTSATAWHLGAKPGAIDMLVHSYLDGNEGLYTESRYGFDVDGIEIKVRKDFGGGLLDYRGFYKNPGA